ncbi:glutathione S-transferase family protein [Methylobacterium organophilum]|uniref:glutathione S-transferase family protein n=1 Tax=Methylobacterium organophilum TaxID=410 RepID=UPI001F1482FB|nr:glutathione S-transferase family protein [Methylobacterium organophilum]UMY19902.1 glutathione S-transferase family protein [Methylobacterium organophilum]
MSPILYDYELDENGYKVRLLLGALGVAHETVGVDMFPGAEQTRSPLIERNPLGTLPIFVDGETVLREAEAILVYLARRHDPAGTWLPGEPGALGQTMAWLVFAARDLHAATLARRTAMFDVPGDAASLEQASRAAFNAMEDHMVLRGIAGGRWFVGESATIADLALFPAFALSRDHGIDHEAYPALRRWMRAVRTLPGFRTMPGIPDYH